MRPEDVRVWEAFLDSHPLPNALVAYDVHLGTTPIPPPGAPDYVLKHIAAVYPKKADVVIYLQHETLVAEVKPDAGLTALGQALGYALLFGKEFPHAPYPQATIITDSSQPDMRWLCARLGIVLLEVPPASASG